MMKSWSGDRTLQVGAALAALLLVVSLVLSASHFKADAAAAAAAAAAAKAQVTLPAGTPIHVRLQQTVSSNRSAAGQEFTAVLSQPVVINGQPVIPKGATAYGKVASARPSGRLKTPAALYLRLTAIDVQGQRVPIQTRLNGRTNKSHKKRNLVAIGGGSGLGAAIGGIAGGGAGALIGAAAGAGAGTAGAYATGKKDITYPVETAMIFRLAQSVALPAR
jgi:hypothetical protein